MTDRHNRHFGDDAAAATRGLAIVTRNTGEFRNTGVETVDPWTAVPH